MGAIIKKIQYLMIKIMKRGHSSEDDRSAIAAADYLLDELLGSAFMIFRDRKFREVAGFGKLNQTEHDRIFNELEVATISLCLFCLEQRDRIIGQDGYHFWEQMYKKLPERFEQKFLELGVDKDSAGLMKKLIRLRHEEYQKICRDSREGILEQKEFKEAKKKDEAAVEAFVVVQSVVIGTADHVRRGKLKEGDELLRVFRNWLFPLNIKISKFIRKL